MFPPGRAKARDKAIANRVIIPCHDNGDRSSCFLGSTGGRRTRYEDHIQLENEFVRERGQTFRFPFRISILNHNVFPLHVAKFAQTLPKRLKASRYVGGEVVLRNPIRGILEGCCASAATPPKASTVRAIAKSAHFRFWILDFRLSEPEFRKRFNKRVVHQIFQLMKNRQSKVCPGTTIRDLKWSIAGVAVHRSSNPRYRCIRPIRLLPNASFRLAGT